MKNEKFSEEEIYLAPEMNISEVVIKNKNELIDDMKNEENLVLADDESDKIFSINEINALREVNRKVFYMSDGSKKAVFHNGSVHVFNEKTKTFDEVDNTLLEEEDGKHFVSRKNNFIARFSREEENNELFSIEKGMHRVTVYAKKNSKYRNIGAKLKAHKKIVSDIEKTDTVLFDSVQEGLDYEYSINESGVKENIVIKDKADIYCYSFAIKMDNVKLEFDESKKRIAFISKDTEEEVFFIPAPFMIDMNGVISTEVSYEVHTVSNSDMFLSIVADSEWINKKERAFPVVIDPQIQLSGNTAISTYSWDCGTLYSAALHTVSSTCCDDSCCNAKRMYIGLNMPTLPSNSRIKNAELKLCQVSNQSTCNNTHNIGLYRVTEAICQGTCTPSYDSSMIDFAKVRNSNSDDDGIVNYTFDVTTIVDQFNNGEVGVMNLVLKMVDEVCGCDNSITLYGSAYGGAYAPQLTITYETNYGVNTTHRTHTHEIGRFGQGSIDLQCGNLMFESEDFAWSGNRMPITIKHLYNSALSGYQYTKKESIDLLCADFSNMSLGYGWKLNIMQSMIFVANEDKYVYTDENGEQHYYNKTDKAISNTTQYIYADENNAENIYNPYMNSILIGAEIYKFDSSGRLIKITDDYGNNMIITYTSGKIVSVSDGAGRKFLFEYSSNKLIKITSPDRTTVTYTYNNNNLSSIAYPGDVSANISYSSNKPSEVVLKDANNNNIYRVAYTFVRDNVRSVSEYAENTLGSKSEFFYSAAAGRTLVSTTEPKDIESGETKDNVIKTVYTFDNEGNVLGQYAYTQDSGNTGVTQGESGINPYMGDNGAGVIYNANNFLVGHSMSDSSLWSLMPGNCSDFEIIENSVEHYAKYGPKQFFLVSNKDQALENGIYQTTIQLPAGQYTFSVYARIMRKFITSNSGVYLRVTDTSGNILAQSERIRSTHSEKMRLATSFELSSAQSVEVQILLDGNGTVLVDAAQLESNPFANPYNILENGNFEHGNASWDLYHANITTAQTFNMNKAVAISGTLDTVGLAVQDVLVKKYQKTRETFTLSGWAKAKSLPARERDGMDVAFRLRAMIIYEDGRAVAYDADFSPYTEDWQYASVQFAKERYMAIEKIRVICQYKYNDGIAYFDDIQLIRNSIETNLSEEDFSTGTTEDDDIETDTSTDTSTEFTELYDEYGNALTETTFADGETTAMYRSFRYTPEYDECGNINENAGNDLIAEVDNRGYTTRYVVDEETSRNKEVIDRCGNKTAYEYDDAGRTIKVASFNANGTQLANVDYEYDEFDNLTKITRGDGQAYNIEYNSFNNLERIAIPGEPSALINYTYKNGNGRLKKVTYANGDTMKAAYNSMGQMVSETWYNGSGVEKCRYKYVYDQSGNIVKSIDLTGKKEYNYIYDDGNLSSCVEYNITIGSNEIITSRTKVCHVVMTYNEEGTLVEKTIIFSDGSTREITYSQNNNNNTETVGFTVNGSSVTHTSNTDGFGRAKCDETLTGSGSIGREFFYLAGAPSAIHNENNKNKGNPTTNLVSRIEFSDGRTLSYEYDEEERIKKVTDSIDGVTEYTYDALGQLLTETKNNVRINTMTYDNYGNIAVKNGIQYSYDDNWHDKLICYNGQEITYDDQGNPTTYLGHTLTWEKGRQLKTFDCNTYTYNANGIRTSKTINGVTHTYTLEGTKILRETWGNNVLEPMYDAADSVIGIIYNGTPYYFHKNLQGDIIAIVNKDAATVAKYSYDAWGVCTINQDSVGIATINPFRYRGYYYDEEIGMYYLQSRYYNPESGRFFNPDDTNYVGLAMTIPSFNLYTYCENDSVNFVDYFGHTPSIGTLTLMHNAVVLSAQSFLFSVGTITTSEVRTSNIKGTYNGRMDIYSYISNRVWEVKRNNQAGISAGLAQLGKYTSSYVYSLYHSWIKIKKTPRYGNISVYGSVVVSNYLVTYRSYVGIKALIVYDYMSLEKAAELLFDAVMATNAVFTVALAKSAKKTREKVSVVLAKIKKLIGNVEQVTAKVIRAIGEFLKVALPIILFVVAIIVFMCIGVPVTI